MSGTAFGIAAALAGLAIAAVAGRLVREERYVRRKWMPAILGAVAGFFGVAALNLGGLLNELSFVLLLGAMVGYGLLVTGAARIANWRPR